MSALAKPDILLGFFRLAALFVLTAFALVALENVLSGTQIIVEGEALPALSVSAAAPPSSP